MTSKYGIVLLAAGSSSRLGTPKQLLQYNNRSLLQHAVNVATRSVADETIVVLGAGATILEKEIGRTKVRKVINPDWKEGMASSVVHGLKEFIKNEESVDGVIFMMCDQPFVSSELLNKLIDTHQQTGKKIVTSSYDGITGPPAFFEKTFFRQLLMLKGDAGARQIIQQNPDETALVPFPEGKFDIDTEADYKAFINSTGGK